MPVNPLKIFWQFQVDKHSDIIGLELRATSDEVEACYTIPMDGPGVMNFTPCELRGVIDYLQALLTVATDPNYAWAQYLNEHRN